MTTIDNCEEATMRCAKSPRRLDQVGVGMTVLLLAVTGSHIAVADEPPPGEPEPGWTDSPYAPHQTTGTNLRVGSAVGSLVHDGRAYTALGGALAAGPRIGRFTFEVDYLYLQLSEPGPSNRIYGRAQRAGVMARADVIRLGPHWIGANSLLALYGELGAARQWHHWAQPGDHEPARAVPIDGSGTMAVVGFGLNLDHRIERPRGFPNRIGWQLGWQLTSSRTRRPDPSAACLGPTCVAGPSMMTAAGRDSALLVTSTFAFTW
jgi:hypothetical protein